LLKLGYLIVPFREWISGAQLMDDFAVVAGESPHRLRKTPTTGSSAAIDVSTLLSRS
jgi:hypothetical protein